MQPLTNRPEHPTFEGQQVEKEEVKQKPEKPSFPPSTSALQCEQPEQESIISHSSPHSACTDDADSQQLSTPPGGADSIKTESDEHGEARPLDDDDSGIIPDPSICTATVCPSLDPSSSSSSLLWLESDAEDVTRPHDLHKIQETLRELQAFLYEAGGMENYSNYSQQLENMRSSRESQPRTQAMWQKAMEMEARIRQAGLTPPSLMKRSASLAKLDQLELSTHDLNDWDFRSELPSSPSSSSSSHSLLSISHDEVHKKQRVLPQTLSGANRTESSCLTSFSCPQNKQGSSTGKPTDISAPPTVSVCAQQQHTKPHPTRRPRKALDKKKIVNVLYNTM